MRLLLSFPFPRWISASIVRSISDFIEPTKVTTMHFQRANAGFIATCVDDNYTLWSIMAIGYFLDHFWYANNFSFEKTFNCRILSIVSMVLNLFMSVGTRHQLYLTGKIDNIPILCAFIASMLNNVCCCDYTFTFIVVTGSSNKIQCLNFPTSFYSYFALIYVTVFKSKFLITISMQLRELLLGKE